MDKPVVIYCYFANDESHRLLEMEDSLGIELDTDMDEVYDIKPIYFFDVSYIFEHPNGKDTMIGSGVEDFRSPTPLADILKLFK